MPLTFEIVETQTSCLFRVFVSDAFGYPVSDIPVNLYYFTNVDPSPKSLAGFTTNDMGYGSTEIAREAFEAYPKNTVFYIFAESNEEQSEIKSFVAEDTISQPIDLRVIAAGATIALLAAAYFLSK